ncbi:hypothetical protein [Catenulispora rubra]|uniref:hypothetical protein n=1 Tax=Catenulispora rubra TaxID=280293 RepID=UPI00189243D2|nr:hypothetical protein [Catenulispora rubra]
MTREYLRGEVLLLLDRMQDAAPGFGGARTVAALRRDAETVPVGSLAPVLRRALEATESWCWEALAADDAAGFRCRCQVAAGLYDFGVCSGLLADKDTD